MTVFKRSINYEQNEIKFLGVNVPQEQFEYLRLRAIANNCTVSSIVSALIGVSQEECDMNVIYRKVAETAMQYEGDKKQIPNLVETELLKSGVSRKTILKILKIINNAT